MSYQLGLRQLQYFLTVAETLHFRKASEILYISQPGLSKQIEKLENELGVKLLERDNRNVKITEAGQYLKNE
ncbi:MAG: LysR family transcriptional regulator, partial [Saprospiraceae bacterium]|nr:LysR family transcriptional regulator [Saprospiraceae bacterium]